MNKIVIKNLKIVKSELKVKKDGEAGRGAERNIECNKKKRNSLGKNIGEMSIFLLEFTYFPNAEGRAAIKRHTATPLEVQLIIYGRYSL